MLKNIMVEKNTNWHLEHCGSQIAKEDIEVTNKYRRKKLQL